MVGTPFKQPRGNALWNAFGTPSPRPPLDSGACRLPARATLCQPRVQVPQPRPTPRSRPPRPQKSHLRAKMKPWLFTPKSLYFFVLLTLLNSLRTCAWQELAHKPSRSLPRRWDPMAPQNPLGFLNQYSSGRLLWSPGLYSRLVLSSSLMFSSRLMLSIVGD